MSIFLKLHTCRKHFLNNTVNFGWLTFEPVDPELFSIMQGLSVLAWQLAANREKSLVE